MHMQGQQCMKHPKINDEYQLLNVATMYYYGLTKNTHNDMLRIAMWHAKEDMNCDALTIMTTQDCFKDDLENLGMVEDSGVFHWYLVNWALGDKTIGTNDIGCLLL